MLDSALVATPAPVPCPVIFLSFRNSSLVVPGRKADVGMVIGAACFKKHSALTDVF
jgi:hypothetical protein